MASKYKIGVDLGGTSIKVGIVSEDNNIIQKGSCKTLATRHWEEIVDDMIKVIYSVLNKANLTLDNCESIGIGSPGAIDVDKGEVVFAGNFKSFENIPLVKKIKEEFKLPVFLENDANCAALGEFVAGAAKNIKNGALFTLGTGLGSGIIYDGKILKTRPGGLEYGHTTLIKGGEACTCGRNGCVETYCSATALVKFSKIAAIKNPDSLLNKMCNGDIDNMDAKIPFDAMKKGDKIAKQVIDEYTENLACALTDFSNILNPEVILIGGGLSAHGKLLTDPINKYIKTFGFASNFLDVAEVKTATLGNDAGIIGAANLI